MSKVTKEQIKHIASLSKLRFSDSELERFENEFNNILGYISKIEECNVEEIPVEHNLKNYKGEILHEDIVKKSKISREKMLQNASNGRNKNGYIRTSKIVSKND